MLRPAPPASSGMFSIEKPAARAFLRTASTAVKSISPAAAIFSSSGKTSSATKRPTRSFSSAMSGGSSGTTMVR